MANKLYVKQSPISRHVSEEYPYKFVLTNMFPSGTYANPTNIIQLENSDGTFGSNLASTLLDGTATISSGILTSQSFVADVATAGKRYKMTFSFDVDSKAWVFILFVDMVD